MNYSVSSNLTCQICILFFFYTRLAQKRYLIAQMSISKILLQPKSLIIKK